jgi:hypothetical protein
MAGMRRRAFVLGSAAIAVVGGAGCAARVGGTTAIRGDPSLTVRNRESGVERSAATVAFDAAASTVSVDGTIPGRNGCRTAELVETAYDAGEDLLTVVVGTTPVEDAARRVCTQAIVAIEYTVTVAFDGGLPGSVTVVHETDDGWSVVERADRDGSAAGASPAENR